MPKQYLIIAGAPRCGTSSLHKWFGEHPEVKPSFPKETRYFIDENHPLLPKRNYHNQGLGGFRALFGKCNGEVLVESTPDYIYMKTPLKAFAEINPKPHVVFLLRRPAERIFSTYKWFANNQAKLPNITFRQFVNDTKKKKLHLPWLDAIEQSKYDNYLPAWYDALGDDHVHVYRFEELANNPGKVAREISRTVGINENFWEDYDFRAMNHASEIKHPLIHRTLQKPYRTLPLSLRRLVKPVYYKYNSKPGEIPTADEKRVMQELDKLFDQSLNTLS